MDGNGRWAERGGLPRQGQSLPPGPQRGVRTIVGGARTWACATSRCSPGKERHRPALVLRTCWPRRCALRRRPAAPRRSACVTVGELDELARSGAPAADRAHDASAGNTGMQVSLALGYSGRGDVVRVAAQPGPAVAAGRLLPEEITPEALAADAGHGEPARPRPDHPHRREPPPGRRPDASRRPTPSCSSPLPCGRTPWARSCSIWW